MNAVYKQAGKRIYLARTMRGYTREILAEKASISTKFLYEIEMGKKGFSAVVLYNLCEALRVNCDYILSGKEKAGYNEEMIEILELFDENQIRKISRILKYIHELI
ncbi:MAG: helix-turn-helix domain-containing protein [Lachnospiraceae bacterium]